MGRLRPRSTAAAIASTTWGTGHQWPAAHFVRHSELCLTGEAGIEVVFGTISLNKTVLGGK